MYMLYISFMFLAVVVSRVLLQGPWHMPNRRPSGHRLRPMDLLLSCTRQQLQTSGADRRAESQSEVL